MRMVFVGFLLNSHEQILIIAIFWVSLWIVRWFLVRWLMREIGINDESWDWRKIRAFLLCPLVLRIKYCPLWVSTWPLHFYFIFFERMFGMWAVNKKSFSIRYQSVCILNTVAGFSCWNVKHWKTVLCWGPFKKREREKRNLLFGFVGVENWRVYKSRKICKNLLIKKQKFVKISCPEIHTTRQPDCIWVGCANRLGQGEPFWVGCRMGLSDTKSSHMVNFAICKLLVAVLIKFSLSTYINLRWQIWIIKWAVKACPSGRI